ncbi:MAG: lipid A biosynthesis acyltransferase [Alcanivoracaceae bacterium]|nr:lipid A biosynthesis acyltransferase [Alcanivoracaceae bacterium]
MENKSEQQRSGRFSVFALRILGSLPLSFSHALGIFICKLLWLIKNREQRITEVNIRKCFPTMPADEQITFGKESLLETGKGMAELAWVWHHPNDALAITHCDSQEFHQTLESGKPIIVLAPHLGCWEVLNFWLASHTNMHAMFAPSGLEHLDDLIKSSREKLGSTMHPATARGVATLVRALKKGNALTAILPDQVADPRSGVFADFYGNPAWTGTLSSKLIQQTGAQVFMAFAKRIPNASGYQIVMQAPDKQIYSEDIETSVRALNKSIEKLISEAPEQYLWSYKRFRVRPKGEPDPYK